MQGPTHMLIGITWQRITDYSLNRTDRVLHKVLPSWISVRFLRWLIIPVGAFFLAHGFLDLFTKVTFHQWDLLESGPENINFYATLLVISFNIFLAIWIFKKWVIREWANLDIISFWKRKNRLLWRKYRYLLAISFAWLIPDGEHVYHWIKTSSFQQSSELGYPLHDIAMWPWRQIPALMDFTANLPTWYLNEWAFMIELGVIVLGAVIIYFLSHSQQSQRLYQKIKNFIFKPEPEQEKPKNHQ